MLETYLSATLMIGAALLVGRAVWLVLGQRGWSGLEGATGLALILAVAGVLARFPGTGKTAGIGLILLVLLAFVALIWARARRDDPEAPLGPPQLLPATAAAAIVILVMSLPFVLHGHWGVIGIGVNNDLGLHLAWSEWLRGGLGPMPEPGYPLGPHALVATVATAPGINGAQAFVGLLLAIGAITALTAISALRTGQKSELARPAITFPLRGWRSVFVAALVALCYLAAAYFAQAAFKETAEALFVLTFTLLLVQIGNGVGRWPALVLIVILAVMTVVSLVRGIIAFMQSTKLDLESDGDRAADMQLRQNKMMFARIKYQALAIVVVAVLLMFNR